MNYSFYDEMDELDDILNESTDEEIFIESMEELFEEKYNSLIEIPIIVMHNANATNMERYAIDLKAEIGKAPQKICVPTSFKWPKEYKSIENAYPGFKYWVNTGDKWYNENPNYTLIYGY